MGSRLYIKKGKKYPSVTTILNIINKPALMYWYGKLGIAECTKIKNSAKKIGLKLHKYIEYDAKSPKKAHEYYKKMNGRDYFRRGYGRKLWGMINQYEKFKALYKFRPLYSEITIVHEEEGYAGTADSIGYIRWKGKDYLVLLDWKTSTSIYVETLFQMVAYYKAIRKYKKKLKIKGIMCISFNKEQTDGEYGLRFIKNKTILKELYQGFLYAKGLYEVHKKFNPRG